jgi:hypothetical protein
MMPALKGRLTDSNKNLVAQTLSLIGKLAKAMGRAINREARPVLGPALRCICDSKPNVSRLVAGSAGDPGYGRRPYCYPVGQTNKLHLEPGLNRVVGAMCTYTTWAIRCLQRMHQLLLYEAMQQLWEGTQINRHQCCSP